jgi:hypothetical protein
MTVGGVSVRLAGVASRLLAALSAYGSTIRSSESARGTSAAAVFLESTFENLQAQGFDALLAMNGNRFFNGADEAHSSMAIDLVAFTAGVNLLQYETTLVDLRTDRTIGRLATLRSR